MRAASLGAGLSDGFIRNIMSGKSESPRGVNLSKLAKVLQTSEIWLLTGEGQEDIVNINHSNKSPEDAEFMNLWQNASEQDRQVILALLRSRRPSKD
ncbi:hypothetical protein [Brucella pituitosa]|uniref:hypothetical protein n=1 Tax=Brucella pituitosa TaxID=571256 RepID=UPI003F4A9474